MSEALVDNAELAALNPADARRFADETILPVFKRLRAEDPVHYTPESQYGPYWSLTKYDDIQAVDTNHEVFSSSAVVGGIMIEDAIFGDVDSEFFIQNFISMDPPDHAPQRKAVTNIVRPDSLMNFEKGIRARATKTLDELPIGEPFDWVDRVSIELTTQMLAVLFDFPFEERRRLTRWSDVATAEPDSPLIDGQEGRVRELLECLTYFKELRGGRIGGSNFDLLTMLANSPDTKDQPDHEFLGNLLLLIVGGNDTTRNTMSGSINAFNQFPDQLAKIKEDPSRIARAVSEIIRWQTPLAYMRRTARSDFVIRGKTIRAGDKVVMWYYSGNRDEDVFENADAVDIDRANIRRHLSFGFGIHRCLGMRLAELQLKILWEEILERWNSIDIVEPPKRVLSSFVNGYSEMMVEIRPK